METLKKAGNLFRRNGVALIADGDHGLFPLRHNAEIQRGTCIGKFGSVFQKVIDHLRNKLVIPQYQKCFFGNIGLYIKAAVGDLLFQRDQHAAHAFTNVKAFLFPQLLHALQTGNIQHAAHKAGKTAALIGNDLQILTLIFRRDGAVQNAVCIACDGSHGGFQLVGNIGNKLAALHLRSLQGIRHGIEGCHQFPDLHAFTVIIHADVEVALGIAAGGLGHLMDGPHLTHNGKGGDDGGNEKHRNGGEPEKAQKPAPDGRQLRGFRQSKDHAQFLPAFGDHHGAHGKFRLIVKPRQLARAAVSAALQHESAQRRGNHIAFPHQPFICGEQHISLHVGNNKLHVGGK